MRPCQHVGRLHQRLGAALRRRGRDHEAQPPRPVLEARECLLAEPFVSGDGGRREGADARLQRCRHQLRGEGHGVDERAVDDMAGHGGADADIVIGGETAPSWSSVWPPLSETSSVTVVTPFFSDSMAHSIERR